MLWDLAEAISITTFRVWNNNIGKGGLKIFLKGWGESKKGGLSERGGINTLCKLCLSMVEIMKSNVLWPVHERAILLELLSKASTFLTSLQYVLHFIPQILQRSIS